MKRAYRFPIKENLSHRDLPEKRRKDIESAIADLRVWREGITWGKRPSIAAAKAEGRR